MRAKLTSKGQITIPLEIRRRLKLEIGQEIEFDPEAPFLKGTKVIDELSMRSVVGSRRKSLKLSSTELVESLRDRSE